MSTVLVTPQDIATNAGYVFMAVEILKYVLRIDGQLMKVRLLGFLLGEAFAFGNAFFTPSQIPAATPNLIWNTFLYGVTVTGAAFGINSVRSGLERNAAGINPANPLAAVSDAVDAAQDAAGNVTKALNKAEIGVGTAAGILDTVKRAGTVVNQNNPLFRIESAQPLQTLQTGAGTAPETPASEATTADRLENLPGLAGKNAQIPD